MDKTPDRSYRYGGQGTEVSRASGRHLRNKSYDFLMSNKSAKLHKRKNSQVFDKSILSLWGMVQCFGVKGNFAKVGELDEDRVDVSISDGHIVLLTS